jgi:hypothetical protein
LAVRNAAEICFGDRLILADAGAHVHASLVRTPVIIGNGKEITLLSDTSAFHH